VNKQKAATKNLAAKTINDRIPLQNTTCTTIKISPNTLKKGGAAKFTIKNKIHHIENILMLF